MLRARTSATGKEPWVRTWATLCGIGKIDP